MAMPDLRIVQPRALLREQVLDTLRNAILEGHYAPGTRLIERELCEALGVSRTSVREALRQLESEQLVRVEPRRGPVVTAISIAEARDIYETRAVFEAAVVRHFIERAPDKAFRQLEQAMADFAAAAQKPDMRSLLSSMERFYATLLGGAGNAVLEGVVRQLMARVAFLRAKSLREPGRLGVSVAEMQELASAILARDPKRAKRAALEHVGAAREAALRQIAREDEEQRLPDAG